MKKIMCTGFLTFALVTPALAAKVYLKDGGVIDARSVWRSQGKVHVLVNRDTLTEFSPAEIDMKRTFKKARKAQKAATLLPQKSAAAPDGTATPQEQVEKKPGKSLPTSPKLP